MNLLAIDTATHACSVAILSDGTVFEEFEIAPRQHTKLLLPMIESVLKRSAITRDQLDAVAFVAGPGSFTGIRIATSVAQGLSLGLSVPVISLSSLLLLACGAKRELNKDEIFPCIDARREQVYWAHYSFAGRFPEPLPIIHDQLSPAEQLHAAMPAGSVAYGTGLEEISGDRERFPRASDGLLVAKKRYESMQVNEPGDAQATYFRRGV